MDIDFNETLEPVKRKRSSILRPPEKRVSRDLRTVSFNERAIYKELHQDGTCDITNLFLHEDMDLTMMDMSIGAPNNNNSTMDLTEDKMIDMEPAQDMDLTLVSQFMDTMPKVTIDLPSVNYDTSTVYEKRMSGVSTANSTLDESILRDVNTTPRDVNATPRDVNATPRDVKATPRDVNATPRDINATPRDVNATPRDINATPRDVNATPRDVKATPRDGDATLRDGNNSTIRENDSTLRDNDSTIGDINTTIRDNNETMISRISDISSFNNATMADRSANETFYGAFHDSNNLSILSNRTSGMDTLVHNIEALNECIQKVDQESEESRRKLDEEMEELFKFYRHIVNKDNKYEFAIRIFGLRHSLWLVIKVNPETYPNTKLHLRFAVNKRDRHLYPFPEFAEAVRRCTKEGKHGYLTKFVINAQKFRRFLRSIGYRKPSLE